MYLLCDKPKYTVGRNKTCDIVAEASQTSLGRFHATLHPFEGKFHYLYFNRGMKSKKKFFADRIEVIDTESKYGTYVNEQINSNVKITPNTPIALKDGDSVRFGFIDFTWKLEKIAIVVLTSTLTDIEKDDVKKEITSLGGRFIDRWSDTCTHLVVKNATLTVKVIQALCHAIEIVKPEYFKAMLTSIRNKSALPKIESFQPIIVQRIAGSTVSLQVNIDRKRLFVGKTFVFMNSRHMEMFKGVIECGMGQCSSLDTKKWQRRGLVKPGTIVVSNTTSSSQSQVAMQTANELNDFLRSKGSRMVPDSEISMAILHCSLDRFCNPSYKLNDIFDGDSLAVPSSSVTNSWPSGNQNENTAATLTHTINLSETIKQGNTLVSTVTSNSSVINLMDDDDDVMLVQSLNYVQSAELAMVEVTKGKRKNSIDNEQPSSSSAKKPNLGKATNSPMKSNENFVSSISQRSTRSSLRNKSFSTTKDSTENQVAISFVHQQKEATTKPSVAEPTSSSSSHTESNLPLQTSNQHEKSSVEISIIEHPVSQKRTRTENDIQPKCVTSTQIPSPKRKRIAHRPTTSAFGGNDSDSDDGLFNFNNAPSAKKSRPAKESDSDSDNNVDYPRSSGPVGTISVPLRPFTQPSQLAPDSWLSRPTPSQAFTDTTIRSKPTKKKNPVEKPKPGNSSAGWQIGQFCISSAPIRIPTQGWYSKETIKSASCEKEMKDEISNGTSLLEDTKWIDSVKCGIQVITKSMNLMSTSGKVFKVGIFWSI